MPILSSGEANRSFVFDFVRTTTRVWHLILASIRKIILGHRFSALDRGLIAAATAAASAPGRVYGQRGESPLQAYALRPVTNCNCVAVRRGGKQQEVTDQSVGDERDSAVSFGEPASDWRSLDL